MSDYPKSTKPAPIKLFKDKKLSPIVEFYINYCYAKQVYRAGWLRKDLPKEEIERVTGHTEGVVVLSDIIARLKYPELNINHIHELASFHELGESMSEVGDIVRHGFVYEGMSRDEKKTIERKAIVKMLEVSPSEVSQYYLKLYDELRDASNKEAKFVDYVDKLEPCFQALIYEKQYPGTDLSEFFVNVRAYIKDDEKLIEILDELESLRK
jgi:5'-deoxynucleotidase YfbR-like HD superfamily hydrolase